jgi:GNAT superfamily N-acetyltransferase
MPAITVRAARRADLAWCRRMDAKTPPRRLAHSVALGDVLIASAGRRRVAYLRLEWIWARFPFVAWIVVDEGRRGDGVGTALLAGLERRLARRGHGVLWSSVQSNAPRALAWHRARGFRVSGKLRRINDDGSDEVFLAKPLGAQGSFAGSSSDSFSSANSASSAHSALQK